jgi:hypothetical protein
LRLIENWNDNGDIHDGRRYATRVLTPMNVPRCSVR